MLVLAQKETHKKWDSDPYVVSGAGNFSLVVTSLLKSVIFTILSMRATLDGQSQQESHFYYKTPKATES